MTDDKGLWGHLEEMAPSDQRGQPGDWRITLHDLYINLNVAGFECTEAQLEIELNRAALVHPDFGWNVQKRDGRYHFNRKPSK